MFIRFIGKLIILLFPLCLWANPDFCKEYEIDPKQYPSTVTYLPDLINNPLISDFAAENFLVERPSNESKPFPCTCPSSSLDHLIEKGLLEKVHETLPADPKNITPEVTQKYLSSLLDFDTHCRPTVLECTLEEKECLFSPQLHTNQKTKSIQKFKNFLVEWAQLIEDHPHSFDFWPSDLLKEKESSSHLEHFPFCFGLPDDACCFGKIKNFQDFGRECAADYRAILSEETKIELKTVEFCFTFIGGKANTIPEDILTQYKFDTLLDTSKREIQGEILRRAIPEESMIQAKKFVDEVWPRLYDVFDTIRRESSGRQRRATF